MPLASRRPDICIVRFLAFKGGDKRVGILTPGGPGLHKSSMPFGFSN